MKPINILCPPTAPVIIGRQGDDGYTPVPVDISGWLLPGTTVSMWFQAPDADEAIPVESGITESPAVWTPRASEMTAPGHGELQLRMERDGGPISNSNIVKIGIPRSIIPAGSAAARPGWASEMMQAVHADADRAEAAASHSPEIRDGYWYKWDTELGDWVNTEIPANGNPGDTGKSAYDLAVEHGYTGTLAEWLASLKGKPGDPGVSPAVSVENITGGHRVTITDAAHPTGQSFDVMNGEPGKDGDFILPAGGEAGQALLSDGSGGAYWGVVQSGGTGLSDSAKAALLACFRNVAWINDQGEGFYQALYDALYPPTNLSSISAVFRQGSTKIYNTDSLDALKPYLTVTAYYDNQTSGTITNYALSGLLSVGTSTITASYGGKSATFTVTVSEKGADIERTGNDLYIMNAGASKVGSTLVFS